MKIVDNQWFLQYNDLGWKEAVRAALGRMDLLPPESRTQYEAVVDWLHEWPCTRYVGLGTRLPWDTQWVIESLSDSTIYMCYYLISHLAQSLPPERFNDAVFDYLLWGRGSVGELARTTAMPVEILEQMRGEMEYWLPMDYRVSADELIPNHLTFMVYHHTAILPPSAWPRGIMALGLGILEGQRMSSSRGIVFPVADAVEEFGADAIRLYLLQMCDPWKDFDFKGLEAERMRRQLDRFYESMLGLLAPGEETPSPALDAWLRSRLQHHVAEATDALGSFGTRRALQHVFFLLGNDVRWYEHRGGANHALLREVADTWLRLLAPFTPHLCDELWERLGKAGLCTLQPYPTADPASRAPAAERDESYLESVAADVRQILQVTGITPKVVRIYCAPAWKGEVLREAMALQQEGHLDVGGLMKRLAAREGIRRHLGDVQRWAPKLVDEVRRGHP